MFLNHICNSVSFTFISYCICFRVQGHDQDLLCANDTHRPQLWWKGINFIHTTSLHWLSCWRKDWHWSRKDHSCRHIFIDQYVWSLSYAIWKKTKKTLLLLCINTGYLAWQRWVTQVSLTLEKINKISLHLQKKE